MNKQKRRGRNHRFRSEAKRLTKHHNHARSRGGTNASRNIFLLTTEHHRAYHVLFGNRTFAEAAEILLRLDKLHNHAKGGGK